MLPTAPRKFRCLIAIICSVMLAATLWAQEPGIAAETAAPGFTTGIYYTGDLFGYFRWPDVQDSTMTTCPADLTSANDAAQQFFSVTRGPGSILVGMGDNFSPELYARVIRDSRCHSSLAMPNKDQFLWDYQGMHWVPALPNGAGDQRCALDDKAFKLLLNSLGEGQGRISMDNVGCFLTRAGYAAVVPGKHDFYFGPQFLRHVARFLATQYGRSDLHRVQMLGANLVIQTRVEHQAARIPYRDQRPHPWYSDDFDGVSFEINDRDTIFPWKQTLLVKQIPADAKVKLCRTEKNDDPDEMPDVSRACKPLDKWERVEDSKSCPAGKDRECRRYSIPSDEGLSFLQPDRDYALCVSELKRQQHPLEARPSCLHFGVYAPFFMYPNKIPSPGSQWSRHVAEADRDGGYDDPRPYVLVSMPQGDVAIFGVVDPELTSHVGKLNYTWQNSDHSNYSTEVKATDPVTALGQLLEFFNAEHPQFKGQMILLAQMPSQTARRVATAFPGRFDLIIAQAEAEDATSEEESVVRLPVPAAAAGSSPAASTPAKRNAHTFVLVPAPFFDSSSAGKLHLSLAWAQISSASSCTPAPAGQPECSVSWRMANHLVTRSQGEIQLASQPVLSFESFASRIEKALGPSAGFDSTAVASDPSGRLKEFQNLTLHIMQTKIHADVAMLQKRDFFPALVRQAPADADLQETLNRIFWKGDFLMPLLVRGDTLKTVLTESKRFDEEDSAPLSLHHEKNRGLVYLGVIFDPLTQRYFVNGEPLDENRLYSVATSDYIALGDTGYPELRYPPVGRAMRPGDNVDLHIISSLVCQHLINPSLDASLSDGRKPDLCDRPTISAADAAEYFDSLQQEPFDSTTGLTPGQHLKIWARMNARRPSLYKTGKLDAELQRTVQERPVWSFSLNRMAFAFLMNQHNNGTESNLASKFAGVPIAQVTAPNTQTTAFDVALRLQRASRHEDLFTQAGLAYSRQLTRQSNAANSDLPVQLKNLLFVEGGVLPHLFPAGKATPALKGLASFRFESQLAAPLATFSLSTSPTTTITDSTPRIRSPLEKLGLRYDSERSWIEGGYLLQYDFGSPLAFVFNPGEANETTCFATTAKNSVSSCVKQHSRAPNPTILPTSNFIELTRNHFSQGLFLNFHLHMPLPFNDRLAYEMDNQGRVLFNRGDDFPVDTKFQDDWIQALVVPLWGNFSLVPRIEFFFYQNKVDNNLFRSFQPTLSLQYNFDWHSGLPWRRAMLYQAPSASGSQMSAAQIAGGPKSK